jgi:hypothetical protein
MLDRIENFFERHLVLTAILIMLGGYVMYMALWLACGGA